MTVENTLTIKRLNFSQKRDMHTYSKLFQEILDSSVWQQPLHVKVVWVTMLAMKSPGDQIVRASIPGLAKRAGVTIEQCLEALEIFKAPDPYSRIKDNEGRKIEETREGWLILNGAEYQRRMSEDDIRAAWREQKARERARMARVVGSEPSPESVGRGDGAPCLPGSSNIDPDFEAFWSEYPRKVGKVAAQKAWSKNGRAELPVLLKALEAQKCSEQWRKDGGKFIPHPATWLNGHRWEDETPPENSAGDEPEFFRPGMTKEQEMAIIRRAQE